MTGTEVCEGLGCVIYTLFSAKGYTQTTDPVISSM